MAIHRLIFTSGGVPVTGLTPTFSSWRYADGTAAPAAPAITEVSAANCPGLYAFEFDPIAPIYFIADGGVAQPAGERFLPDVITPDDFVGLLNSRFFDIVTDGNGNLLSANVYHYASKADADAAANEVFIKRIEAVFDGDGNIAGYREGRP